MIPRLRFLQLLFSSGAGQVLGIGCSLLVPFLYEPSSFGVYGVFLSINRLFSAVATGNLEGVIYTTQNPERRRSMVILPLRFLFTFVLVLVLAILLIGKTAAQWLKLENGTQIFWFIPLLILSQGLGQIFVHFFNAEKQEKSLHAMQLSTPSLPGLAKLSLYSFQSWGLIIGHTAGATLATLLGVFAFPKSIWKGMFQRSNQKYFKLFRSWWGWGAPSGLINLLGLEALFLVTQNTSGVVLTGLLTFGFRYVKLPVEILNGALTKTFLSDSAGKSTAILRGHVFKALKRYLWVALPFFLLVFFGAEVVVQKIWGPEWADAGKIATTVAPFLFIHGMGSLVAPVADLLGKLKWEFWFMALLTSGRIIILYLFQDDWWQVIRYFMDFSIVVWLCYFGVMVRWLFKD